VKLQGRFDAIFTQKTRFETLNQTLKRISRSKAELLLVLDRPDVPLHTNASESDIGDHVKKRKINGGIAARQANDDATPLPACRRPAANLVSRSGTF